MFLYCKSWDLEVNPSKTKITIFSNRKQNQNIVFMNNGQALEIDDKFDVTWSLLWRVVKFFDARIQRLNCIYLKILTCVWNNFYMSKVLIEFCL